MKQLFAILCAIVALSACNQAFLEPELGQKDEIQVNLTITRSDAFDTKASVKTDWAEEDVVFVFFKGVDAPKYLELKYSNGKWTGTRKNGLVASDLTGASDKKMTAIYLPYGSNATVAASETDFVFDGLTYNGYFLQAELVDYTFVSGVLAGTLNMVAPTLTNASDKLIHFDISGFTSDHEYDLYQDYVKPLTFTKVSADGTVTKEEGKMGKALAGYIDGSMMIFSGILDASAVGVEKDYQFSINDKTASVLYTRDAGNKTLNGAKYIGIGDISSSTWIATEYVYLGFSDVNLQRVMWATKNLGATTVSGEGSYGNFYAWGMTEGYPLSGTFGNYTCSHEFRDIPSYEIDFNGNLKPEYDAAHVAMKGLWRMPTIADLGMLINMTVSEFTNAGTVNGGMTFQKKGSFTDKIFLPAAGFVDDDGPSSGSLAAGIYGVYASATQFREHEASVIQMQSNGIVPADETYAGSHIGHTIRPVFTID